MASTGRNAPCPCGSGRKYKQCCLRRQAEAESEGRRRATRRERLLEIERRAVTRLYRWIGAVAGVDPRDRLPEGLANDRLASNLVENWALYCTGDDDSTWLDGFLRSEPALPADESAWLLAQRTPWIGLWEVVSVEPGAGMGLRCRLTGESRDVIELSASQMARPGAHLLGRIADFDGVSLICGLHGRMLPPGLADGLHDGFREALAVIHRLPRRRLLRPAELRSLPVEISILLLMEQLADRLEGLRPRLQTTDGDDLVYIEERFELAAGLDEVATALVGLDGVFEVAPDDDGARVFQVQKPGNAKIKSWDNTIVGWLRLGRDALRVTTTSRPRADALRARLEALGLTAVERRETSPEEAAASAPPPSPVDAVPPPEVQAVLREHLEGHYGGWPDEPLPALGGKTPRQAIKTKGGREQVERILREIAFSEAQMPAWQVYGVDRIRDALGL